MTAVEVWATAARLMTVGMRSPLPMIASGAAMMLVLATLVGIATGGAARRGRAWHWIAMAIVWAAIQEYAAPDGRLVALALPLGALLLLAAGAWIGRRVRWAPVVLGVLLVTGGLVAPEVTARRRVAAPVAPAVVQVRPDAPDVVVVVLAAVRADHLSAYGYARPTSPRFDALARDGTLFLDAVSPATWSLPAHASLFTGRFPSAHGAHDEHPYLDAATPTLAERFATAGYETRAFTANPWIADSLGVTRGFRWTDEAWRTGDVMRPSQAMPRLLDRLGIGGAGAGGALVAGNVETWLAARPAADRPAFTVVDFLDAQESFRPLPTESEQAIARYDAGIAYADGLLGRVVDALVRRGALDRTIVVVLADHGALLGEHGEFGPLRSLYEPLLHVPLLVRYPPLVPAGLRIATPVSVAGVYATVLDLAGLPPEPVTQVGSLRVVIEGGAHPGPVLAEQFATERGGAAQSDDPLLARGARFRAYREGRRKLVDSEPGGTFFFDLDEDPGEGHDVSMRDRLLVGPLREHLDVWRQALGLPDLRARAPAGSVPLERVSAPGD
jgi:arylsulfatase A-like enzyme